MDLLLKMLNDILELKIQKKLSVLAKSDKHLPLTYTQLNPKI